MDDYPLFPRKPLSLAELLLASATPTRPPPPNPLSALGLLSPLAQPSLLSALSAPTPIPPRPPVSVPMAVKALTAPPLLQVKRKVYFAFDFDDVIRVNNVRQIGKIGSREQRNPRSFTDRSMWEKRDIKSEENLKALMRQAVHYSSAVCVLIGTNTWKSRWVNYEIARAVIDERGLVGVQLNGINHHIRKTPDRIGLNPLHLMGIYHDQNGRFYLYEKHVVVKNAANAEVAFVWRPYGDFTDPVPLPKYIPAIPVAHVMPLSIYTREYDAATDDGFGNIGVWIDAAATQAGR
jgi:MTH538 TIR-like domain (DUF1863)